VAKWFPQRHQLVLATLSMYVGVYGLFRMVKGNPKPQKLQKSPQAVAAPVSSSTSEGGFQGPSLENFDQWAEKEENWKKWEDWISTPGNLEKWEKEFESRQSQATA